ncbi:MAG: NAD(P)H-dependent flavin oxidoreductase [Gammaproteobacteria bacterium]
MKLHTRFTARFGVQHPVLNAPMALVAGGALAAAVTRAGGLGLLGGGYAGTLGGEPSLDAEITRAGDARIGVGFIGWALAQVPRRLDEALERRPACVFLSFGDPALFAPRIHAAGVPLICQVQTLADLRAAVAAGASAVVAQGTEAGGHGGRRATLPFVPEAADYLARHAPDTLLLAAGGIADGRGLAAALMLGADGVVVGTRFWAANEALTPVPAVTRALQSDGDGTVRTRAIDALRGVPWPPAWSFRVLRNRLTDDWADREADAEQAFASLREPYQRARATGDPDIVPAVAGEAIGLLHGRAAAADIVTEIVDAACALLSRPDPLDWRPRTP